MTRTRVVRGTWLALCAAMICLGLGACTSGAARASAGGPAGVGSGPAGSAGGYGQQALSMGRQFSDCARAHGLPNFPDPVIDDSGGLNFPAPKDDVEAAYRACGTVLEELPPPPAPQAQPPSAEDLQHMRQFAQCMRDHGAGDFPDPAADGTFPVRGTPYEGLAAYAHRAVAPQHYAAFQACVRYEDTWRLWAS